MTTPDAAWETWRFRVSVLLAPAGLVSVIVALATIASVLVTIPVSAALTLVSRSNGLEIPSKEEGHTEFELGDVDGDGNLDIVSVGDHGSPLVNSDQHGLMTWLGDGAGNWTVHQVGSFGYGGVALGDLDRDGHLDAAWGIHHDWAGGDLGDQLIEAALGDGTGANWIPWDDGLATTGETWGMFATDLADFDLDGRLDILSQSFGGSNGIRIYRNVGDGSWESALVLSGSSVAYTIETGDFDADGNPDFACTRTGGTVWLGDGSFGFEVRDTGITAGTPYAIDVGDLDRDGADDIVVALGSLGVRAYRYDRTSGVWIDASNGLPGSGSFDLVQFGYLDDDPWLDVVTYADPTGQVYLGDGAGNWTSDVSWTMPSPGTASALRVDGDVDHDGRDDIVVSASMSGFPFYRNQLRVYSPYQEPDRLAVRVDRPRGGEVLAVNSIREIRWSAAVPPAAGDATARLRVSYHGDAGPWEVIADEVPNNGRYEWQVAGAPSETCRLEVTIESGPNAAVARSQSDFSIVAPVPSGAGEQGTAPSWGVDREDLVLEVMPNPSRDLVCFRWGAVGAGDTTLEVCDVVGRSVFVRREDCSSGCREVWWVIPDELPDGVYFARLRAGSVQAVRPVVLAR
ncbi:MAG: VCBS repeat-containing protein [Candidatus Eisenbacteria bacterium]